MGAILIRLMKGLALVFKSMFCASCIAEEDRKPQNGSIHNVASGYSCVPNARNTWEGLCVVCHIDIAGPIGWGKLYPTMKRAARD